MANLFPAIEPFDTAFLDVGSGHRVRYERCGRPDGIPVLFIHGGPASGFSARQRRFFDPDRYQVILFDQRGSGGSTPHGEQSANTTPDLVSDMELLRGHLGIDRWLLFGGSWGSALAMVYASAHPDRCLGQVLRGVFLTGQADMDWFFRDAGALMPDAWQVFAGDRSNQAPGAANMLGYYSTALDDDATAAAACARWMAWEASLTRPGGTPVQPVQPARVSAADLRKYRLQAAYLKRLCDLGENAVLDAARRSALLPTAIVHGRLDWVCRAHNAWKIHKLMAGSRLRLVDHAGHDPYHADMIAALVSATDTFAAKGNFSSLGSEWIT